ncbi:MAG: hypothetical protein AAFN70_19040, partial [Planctomycetota bacterium]
MPRKKAPDEPQIEAAEIPVGEITLRQKKGRREVRREIIEVPLPVIEIRIGGGLAATTHKQPGRPVVCIAETTTDERNAIAKAIKEARGDSSLPDVVPLP